MAKFTDRDVSMALMGRGASREYPFPGLPNVTVAIKMLSEDALDSVRIQAVTFCKQKQIELAWDPDFLDRTIRRFTVFHACLDPATGDRFFAEQADVARLDSITVTALYELYRAHCESHDPLAYASEEEVMAMVDALKKGEMHPARLSLFERNTLVQFAISMVSLLQERPQTPK